MLLLMVEDSGKITLKDFIHNHYSLVATIGVFGALTALFVRFENVPHIAFITLMILIVLVWELLDSFPEIGVPLASSMKLILFEFLMIALLMSVGWLMIDTYVRIYYQPFTLTVFLGLYLLISAKTIEKTRFLDRIHRRVENHELYASIRFVIFIVVVGTVMELARISANFLWSLFPS